MVLGTFSLSSSLFANEDLQELRLVEDSIENPSLSQPLAYSRETNNQESGKTYARFPSTKNSSLLKVCFFQTNIWCRPFILQWS